MNPELEPATGLRRGSFGIGRFAHEGRSFPALVKPAGDVVDVSRFWPDTHALFDDWRRSFDRLVDLAARAHDAALDFESVTPLPPLAHPQILGAGGNYRQHVAEMMTHNRFNQHNRRPGETDPDFFQRNLELVDARARDGMPFFFTGLHSSLVGARDDIVLPKVGNQHDWELELTCVIGRSERYVTPEAAHELIAGFTVVNDLGSVDTFRRKDVNWGYDWVGKHQPSFKPAGPFVVPAAFVSVDKELRIQLKLNGETKQDWPVTDMIFSPEEILSYASERVRLLPGDFLLTGSPPGNGALHGRFLSPGDVIESEITGLGRQRNHCRAESAPNATARWRVKGGFAE